ncbi:hypothetical protein [Endozoicomonas sp. 8E]|uniref:hypothetical protein n=1 Tax=Endozoicomonas sp. 8E TaxID=3035692 RepID=UPI002938E58E|nr:hypothetical protein [Endozoicomonas sp. 8E]WOG26883.1 hypothetical protein P6910_20395 [Endozoicomonas sp. 8E]
MSVTCQAGSLTRCFIVELEENAGSQKRSIPIKPELHTLLGTPSDIVHINDYEQPDFPPYKKRHWSLGYGIEKAIIESISWQWLYVTNLLIVYELSVTTKASTRIITPFLSLPLEVLVAVAWFLKSYWNLDARLFSTIEQQVTSIMTEGDHPFATITAVFGSGDNSPQYQSSESSGQLASKATLPSISSFISPLNNDYSGGNGGDQVHRHTLGLNCFVHPCYGFCQLHPLSGSSEPAEWPLNTLKSSCPHLATGHCSGCMGHFDPAKAMESRQPPLFKTFNDFSDIQLPFDSDPQFDDIDGHFTDLIQNAIDATESLNGDVPMLGHLSSIVDDFAVIHGSLDLQRLLKEDELAFAPNPSETQQTTSKSSQLDQSQPHLSRTGAAQAKASSGQKNCGVTLVGEDGQERSCVELCKNAEALRYHKRTAHSGQRVCAVIVVGEDGQRRPCRKAYKNAKALSDHKSKYHSGQQACEVIVVGEDGQERSCGRAFGNAQALLNHKSRHHGEQQTCEVIVFAKEGQQRPCGKVCKSAQALSDHKSKYHRGQQTCKVIAFGEDGQQRPCGKLCKNAKALSDHKNKKHRGQQTCKVIIFAEDGQQRPCGKVCRNAGALSSHRGRYHRGQQTCEVTVLGADNQQRPCRKVCKNTKALSDHKRRDRKRKPADLDEELSPPGNKVNKCDYQEKLAD